MSKSELKKNYHRRVPPLVRVKVSENNKENNEILILLKPEEIKNIK